MGESENSARLADYSLQHRLNDRPGGDDSAPRLLDHAVKGAARLVASYMAAGFVHGVLNTDNISITAESFDYGPWRFNPTWNGSFTAPYFDESGLYAFGRQAETLQWNLLPLATCLTHIAPVVSLQPVFASYAEPYRPAFFTAVPLRA